MKRQNNGSIFHPNAALEQKEKFRLERMERYRRPLRNGVPLYSDNMGLRRMNHLEKNEAYSHLNTLIRDIYDQCSDCKDYKELYRRMQNVQEDKQTDWNQEAFTELSNKCGDLRENWEIRLFSKSQYWDQMNIGPHGNDNITSKIKAYVSVDGPCVKDLFIGAAEKIVKEGETGFTAKVSKIERDEMICFYLKRNEFFLLEEYLNEHFANLRKGNPFIAHRGFIGISKDLLDVDSHNAQQAKLMWDYFQIVNGREDIELEEMYQMFVLGWNGELSEDNCFCKHFSGATAQLFVLMMDSLDVLVGRKQIDDNSLLINDDPKIWNMMVDARCWDDVGRRGYT